ncbi:MAG: sigma 54-interacting transcriptional regulator [Azoarcus sp.]|jgi:Nif-specific regulatory protein|nr:sigma 54-interacting transcriptional regulator [Azoarcus sp.]
MSAPSDSPLAAVPQRRLPPVSATRHADKLCEFDFGECRTNFLPLLQEMNRIAAESGGIEALLDTLLDIMERHLNIHRAVVSLADPASGRALIHKSRGLSEEEAARGIYAPGEGALGKVMLTGEAVVIPRIGETTEAGAAWRGRAERERAFLCVPIRHNGDILGALSAERRYKNIKLLYLDVDILAILAAAAAQSVALYLAEKVRKVALEDENRNLRNELAAQFAPENIIGQSRPMRNVYGLIERVVRTRATVLLLGESGVGKERVASAIHYHSPNANGPFIRFNCAALPESIIESELFGHERGAFTGAVTLRRGRFEEADGGTLFLDEIGELSPAMQAKLLRVLQEKRFERVGGNVTIQVDIRIIAATNRDLKKMAEEGAFREDLYYRLNIFPITLPPLRARGNDISLLAHHFAHNAAARMGIDATGISPRALAMMMSYHWPGNVRELENVIERAVILSESGFIESRHLPPSLQTPVISELTTAGTLDARLAVAEYDMIVAALKQHRGNTTQTASHLGLTRRILGLRMARYNLNYKDYRK